MTLDGVTFDDEASTLACDDVLLLSAAAAASTGALAFWALVWTSPPFAPAACCDLGMTLSVVARSP